MRSKLVSGSVVRQSRELSGRYNIQTNCFIYNQIEPTSAKINSNTPLVQWLGFLPSKQEVGVRFSHGVIIFLAVYFNCYYLPIVRSDQKV